MAMTRDDIIRIAEKSGIKFRKHLEDFHSPYCDGIYIEEMEAFVQLIAAAEREACAKVADDGCFLHDDSPEAKFGKACAAAIRARGKK
jgi:hypothetical protein